MLSQPPIDTGRDLGHRATNGDYDAFRGVKDEPGGPLGKPKSGLNKGKELKAVKGCAHVIRTAPNGFTIRPGNVEPLLDPLKLFKEGMGGDSKHEATAGAALNDPNKD